MTRTFTIVESFANAGGVSQVASLEAQLVYHTLCGSLGTAISAAENLLKIKRSREDKGEVFRHLLNASVTYRTAGLFDQSIACLGEAVEIARGHRLPKCLARALPMLAHLALERGLNTEAGIWLDEMTRLDIESDDAYVSLDTTSIRVRLAIAHAEGTGQLKGIPQISPNSYPRVGQPHTYTLALHAAILLANGSSLTDTELCRFEQAHLRSRRCIAQAFGTYVLFVAMRRNGKGDRAQELVDAYHETFRRETWAASELFTQLRVQLRDVVSVS